jgi:hypothetical protein
MFYIKFAGQVYLLGKSPKEIRPYKNLKLTSPIKKFRINALVIIFSKSLEKLIIILLIVKDVFFGIIITSLLRMK